jgi:hypothetical protein
MATQPISQKSNPVLWLVTEETSEPYLHQLDVDCDCKSCESKKSKLVLPQ